MTSKDVETPKIAQRSPSNEKVSPSIHIREGEAAAIIAALESYVPGTAEVKRLVRRIDFVLLPILWWMYILAHLDRSNIANANAAGMSEDLGLSDNRKCQIARH
jgi:Ni,Fe-hydrogenase I large subunit